MRIKVACTRLRYARGDYSFIGFTEPFRWLVAIRGLAMAVPSFCLFRLAKDGRYGSFTARQGFEIESGFRDYFLAREVAIETSLLRAQGFGDSISPNRDTALRFA